MSTSKPRAIRLTKVMRQSLINSICADLPTPNYDAEIADFEKKSHTKLPGCIKTALKNPDTRDYIRKYTASIFVSYERVNPSRYARSHQSTLFRVNLPNRGDSMESVYIYSSQFKAQEPSNWPHWVSADLKKLAMKAAQQQLDIVSASRKIDTAINACTTVKVLRERHPHFNKYTDAMVAEHAPPIISNLPDDNLALSLEKLGWPDGVEPAATKTKAKRAPRKKAAKAKK